METDQQLVFYSKIGWEIIIPILLILGGCIAWPIWSGAPVRATMTVTVIVLLTFAFILFLMMQTRYRITGEKLHVHSGFFAATVIDIDSITQIKPTRNPIASPAGSLDRIEIQYGNRQSILISPQSQDRFLKLLTDQNRNIKLLF